jgi:CHASE3 domain sensor protein
MAVRPGTKKLIEEHVEKLTRGIAEQERLLVPLLEARDEAQRRVEEAQATLSAAKAQHKDIQDDIKGR